LRDQIQGLLDRVDHCDTSEQRIDFEKELRELLLKMVARPLIELLCRVTQRLYVHSGAPLVFAGRDGFDAWRGGRRRILEAIPKQDEELVLCEPDRSRRLVLARLGETADTHRKPGQ